MLLVLLLLELLLLVLHQLLIQRGTNYGTHIYSICISHIQQQSLSIVQPTPLFQSVIKSVFTSDAHSTRLISHGMEMALIPIRYHSFYSCEHVSLHVLCVYVFCAWMAKTIERKELTLIRFYSVCHSVGHPAKGLFHTFYGEHMEDVNILCVCECGCGPCILHCVWKTIRPVPVCSLGILYPCFKSSECLSSHPHLTDSIWVQ